MPDGSEFRNQVLERYDFTPEAQAILRQIPVEIHDLTHTNGGGGWYPGERRIILNGVQDEACLHELAHAWADETGFYVDPHPDDPDRNGRNFAYRRDVDRAAIESDPAFQRVAFLAWEYTNGNPRTGFEGMKEIDWERFAGLASGVMGDIRLMPPYLRRWYEPLFGGHPHVSGPSELPSTVPVNWRQGIGLVGTMWPAAAMPGGGVLTLLDRLRRWLTRR
ncbi:MAG TPA: hypothetical protein VFV93_01805 [Thermomicrobiales bacterium]|nr:hypothetical protein [Thermomicrobiales bacterium]